MLGGCRGYSHAAAGGDLSAVTKPSDLGLGEAGDAGRTDDGRLPVGHALLRLAVLKAPHICKMCRRTTSGVGEGPATQPGTQQGQPPGPAGEQAGSYGDGLPQGMQRGCPGVRALLPSSAGVAQLAQGTGWRRARSRVPGAALRSGSVPAVPGVAQPHRPHARPGTPAHVSPTKDGVQAQQGGISPGAPQHLSLPQPIAQLREDAGMTLAPRARLGHPPTPSCPAVCRLEARSN